MNRPGHELYPKSPLGEQEPGVPTGRDVEWQPLVDYRRAGVSETTIHGAVAWAHGDEVFHSFGGDVLCYGRSMMKPLMRMRSITAPDMIDAVVAENIANAAQKTPDALSARFGPIEAPHGTPAAPAAKSGDRPLYIDR